MEPDKFYYDPFTKQNVCIAFERTGYCGDHSTCKYLHRRNLIKDANLMYILYMEDDYVQPERYKPINARMKAPEPYYQPVYIEKPRASKKKIDIFSIGEKEQPVRLVREPRKEEKVDLMPSLKKRAVKPSISKVGKCHQCRINMAEDSLFCNSFCGHLMCYDCIERDKTCSECSVPVDLETAHQFFKTYCKGCHAQNLVKDNSKLCFDCKFYYELRSERLKRYTYTVYKITDHNMQCIICMNAKKEHAVFPCAHMLYCYACVKLVMTNKICFFCNSSVNGSCKIYY